MDTYTITLADGTEISNLVLNGDTFVSEEEVSSSVFEDNCATVVISDGETETTYENMTLANLSKHGDNYWITLRQLSDEEVVLAQMEANIEFLAMMADVEL